MSLVKRQKIESEINGLTISNSRNESSSSLPSPVVQLSGHEGPVLSVKYDPFGQFLASSGAQSDIFLWRPPSSPSSSNNYNDTNTYNSNNTNGHGNGNSIPPSHEYDNPHVQTLSGHKRAVLDLCWSRDGTKIFSAGADHTVGSFDIETGVRVRKHVVTVSTESDKSGMVNSIDIVRRGTELVVAGTDAGIVAVFDPRDKFPVYTLRPTPFANMVQQINQVNGASNGGKAAAAAPPIIPKRGSVLASSLSASYPILAVATNQDGSLIFSAGVDDTICAWDPRSLSSYQSSDSNQASSSGQSTSAPFAIEKPLFTLKGHTNSITSLDVGPDNQTLLSNSMDSTVRTWNIKPFVATPVYPANSNNNNDPRAIKVYDGAPAGIENRLLRARWSNFSSSSSSEPSSSSAPSSSSSSSSSNTNAYFAAGSGDHTTVVWDAKSGRMLYKLTGHQGAVTDVSFSPKENVLASASADGSIILGELSANGTRIG